jgi:hypothetical protein
MKSVRGGNYGAVSRLRKTWVLGTDDCGRTNLSGMSIRGETGRKSSRDCPIQFTFEAVLHRLELVPIKRWIKGGSMAISPELKRDRAAIRAYLKDRHIVAGLGNEENSCSIAGMNAARGYGLTDRIAEVDSLVVGEWIIRIQDAMPDGMRNSAEWRKLLPLAAGLGRAYEKERRELILDWMWGTVLPTLQHRAESHGYGPQWLAMTVDRTTASARIARAAADAADAAHAADAAAYAAYAAADAAHAAAAADAAHAAAAAAAAMREARWTTINPPALLKKLIAVGA